MDASRNTEALDRNSFTTRYFSKRELGGELTGVDVEDVENETDTRSDLARDFHTESLDVVVALASTLVLSMG